MPIKEYQDHQEKASYGNTRSWAVVSFMIMDPPFDPSLGRDASADLR